ELLWQRPGTWTRARTGIAFRIRFGIEALGIENLWLEVLRVSDLRIKVFGIEDLRFEVLWVVDLGIVRLRARGVNFGIGLLRLRTSAWTRSGIGFRIRFRVGVFWVENLGLEMLGIEDLGFEMLRIVDLKIPILKIKYLVTDLSA